MRTEMKAGQRPPARICDHPGCAAAGEFRAPRSRARFAALPLVLPRSRARLQRRLELLRWDERRRGRAGDPQRHRVAAPDLADGHARRHALCAALARLWPVRARGRGARASAAGPAAGRRTQQEHALAIFNLEPPFTLVGLKARYKELVKLHHPDVHGGDKAAEERLKIVNLAYATLKASYFT